MRSARLSSGFTLIELMLAMAILSMVGGGVFLFVSQSSKSWDAIRQESEMMAQLRRASEDINLNLMQSSALVITIDKGGSSHWDTVEFQIPVSFAGGAIIWGADGNAGWKYRYAVVTETDKDNLYRMTFNGPTEVKRLLLLGGIDRAQGGKKGAIFTLNTVSGKSRVDSEVRGKRNPHSQGDIRRSIAAQTVLKN